MMKRSLGKFGNQIIQYTLVVFLFLVNQNSFAQESERVQNFNISIQVDSTGLTHITEHLEVLVQGKIFKRGIVRFLPLSRLSSTGQMDYGVNYDIDQVLFNGQTATYHTEFKNGNFYIYVGDKDILLKPGVYNYQISYTTNNQIGHFENFDELYWNVTGTGWSVPIDQVTVNVEFPKNATIIESACYSGSYGSQDKDCLINTIAENSVKFSASNLKANEGLTIVSAIEPGLIHFPATKESDGSSELDVQNNGDEVGVFDVTEDHEHVSFISARSRDYIIEYGTVIFLILLLMYYAFTIIKYGIDPPKPTVYPQFEPPNQLSPASIGYLERFNSKQNLATSSIVNLAYKGYIKIKENEKNGGFFNLGKKIYELERTEKMDIENLAPEESFLLNALFYNEKKVQTIDGEYDSKIAGVIQRFNSNLSTQWNKFIFEGLNTRFWIFPIVFMLVYSVFFYLYYLFQPQIGTAFFFDFYPFFLVLNFLIFLVYIYFIRKPSSKKLQLKSDIEGFKMYLKTADVNQLQAFNPPKLTPEVFEKNLPYAIAFGVGKIWGQKFRNSLESMLEAERPTDFSSFDWYHGDLFEVNSFNLLSDSLGNSITAPSSSSSLLSSSQPASGFDGGSSSGGSSSSGGGFSGGGGGGGGGGGW